MSYLIYVNGLGPNYKGDNLYEFIFSDSLDVWGEAWDNRPSNGYPQPPDLKYIKINLFLPGGLLLLFANGTRGEGGRCIILLWRVRM